MKSLLSVLLSFLPVVLWGQNIITVAGTGSNTYNGDNISATSANISAVTITVDKNGYIYLAEVPRIRKIGPGGVITTIAGTGVSGTTGDGGPATAAKISAIGIAVDRNENIYFTSWSGATIRKISNTGIITNIGGTGTPGYSGDGGPANAAAFNNPTGICVDTFGNVYVGDLSNNCIRKINTAGIVSTIAGIATIPGFSGDGGPATAAKMSTPVYIGIGSDGNIYCPDRVNVNVRKINLSTGIISTVAGVAGSVSHSGDGGPATAASFKHPNGVAMDSTGNLFIADYVDHVVRKVDIDGIVTTIAGTGMLGYSGDGGPATNARFNQPNTLGIDRYGNVYVNDTKNYRIRRITYDYSAVQDVAVNPDNVVIHPNPSENQITINVGVAIKEIAVSDILGKEVLYQKDGAGQKEIKLDIKTMATGLYVVKVNGIYAGKFVKE